MGNSISTLFCPECGAANETTDPHCNACGQPLLPDVSGEDTSRHDLLLDRYRILTTLGSGGFSSVYRALDTQSGDIVAIKQINLRGLNAAETIDATNTFNRELSALSGLDHRQVPRLYHHFQDRDHWYLVLEYFDGPTLETYLEERLAGGNPLRFDEVLDLGLQLCTVLDYLHTHYPPIIFRDLKPGNIIRGTDGKLFLVDFGIARHFRSGQPRDTQLLGSPGYAAPEQYGRAQTSPRSDIYSLGVLLYAMLSRSDPAHYAPDISALDLSLHAGGRAMHDLLARMMALDPADRPGSAREVAAALEAIKQREQHVQNTARIWIAPTPQDYPAASGSQHQLLLQYQPAPATLPAQGRRLSRRNVMLGLGALTVAVGTGIGVHALSTISLYGRPAVMSEPPADAANTSINYDTSVTGITWSKDGQWIATCSPHIVQIIRASNEENLFAYAGTYGNSFNGLAFSPSGVYLAVASSEQGVMLLSAKHGVVMGNFPPHAQNTTQVNGVAWSPDMAHIASANSDKTVKVWDVASGSDIMTYQAASASPIPGSNPAVVKAVAWSPDGSYIASGSSDGLVVTWNFPTGEHYVTFGYDNFSSINAVAWSPDSRYVASASDDTTVHILRVSLESGQPFVFTGHNAGVTALAWSPDGSRIATGDTNGTILIWDAFTGKHTLTYQGNSLRVNALTWSPDSLLIAAGIQDHAVMILKDVG